MLELQRIPGSGNWTDCGQQQKASWFSGLSGTAPHPLTYCNAVPGARCCVNTDKSNRATNRGSWELPLGQLPGKCDRSAGVTCPCPAPSWVSVKASVLGQFLRSKGPAWHLSWHHGLIGVCAGGMGRACTPPQDIYFLSQFLPGNSGGSAPLQVFDSISQEHSQQIFLSRKSFFNGGMTIIRI